MISSPIFCSDPWGLVLKGEVSSLEQGEVSGEGSPRAFLPLGKTLNWGGSTGRPPRAGPSFLWRGTGFSSWHVPAGHHENSLCGDFEAGWHSLPDGSSGHLRQTSLLHRPEANDATSPAARQGRFVDWLIHSFQELGQDELQGSDAAARGFVRRNWKRAERVWLSPNPDEPRIELIIRMAQDHRLLQTLESLSRTPRRILVRIREQTPISRVKELDAACIRTYVRLPGRGAIEKAGTRQELLSVQRKASHDTLENRVTAWTLENLRLRAERWKLTHGIRARTASRYRSVAKLARHAAEYRTSEFLEEASSSGLSHPVPANYPLMMDPRYKRVYRAYRELLRYEKIKDDSWTWRRALWSEGVGQLLSCTLRRLFRERYSSRPYYRSEPDRGKWLLAPANAGPFETQFGPLYVIDTHEADLNAEGFLRFPEGSGDAAWEMIGALGSDIFLWWPEKHTIFPIWASLWTGSDQAWRTKLADAARAISIVGLQVKQARSPAIISRGLIIGTSLASESVEIDVATHEKATAVGIPVPMSLDTQDVESFAKVISTLAEAIELAVDLPS
jgi:hypothetical protein